VASAVVLAAAVAAGATWLATGDGSGGGAAVANDTVPLGTAVAARRALVAREDVDGTLGFGDATVVRAPAAGTVTRLRAEGSAVRRGESLLSVDAVATGWLLYGRRPLYRDLGPGSADGGDVREVERNLKALGYDPGTADTDWTSATTAAVEDFQADRGLEETGRVVARDFLVRDGAARVGAHGVGVGDAVAPGAPVTRLTGTRPVVAARIDATAAPDVHAGDRVEVTLPDGRDARGRVARVGRVAAPGQDGASASVALTVTLTGRRRLALDGAPVNVSLETGRTRAALAVPVTALVATAPGAYGVELATTRRVVRVAMGTSADGWVAVTPAAGSALREGTRVVVPR
jgi:peptidoglycan hydrolase-like protein with peptidoglycan-binding domain